MARCSVIFESQWRTERKSRSSEKFLRNESKLMKESDLLLLCGIPLQGKSLAKDYNNRNNYDQ